MKFLFVILFLLSSCSSSASHIQLTGLNQNKKLVLEPEGSETQCEEKTFTQWGILFNIIPISSPMQAEMFPDSKKSYRFYEKWTTTDILITIPLAYITTLTRKSLVVESCESNELYFASKEDFDQEVEKQLTERVKSSNETSRKIEEIQKGAESLKGKVRDKIILYNGKEYEGEIIIPKEKTDYIEFNILVPKKHTLKIKKTDIKEQFSIR